MASNVVLASNFNTQKLSFSQLKVLDSGGKQAYTNYDGGMFIFQTPSCNLPYGMSAFDKAGPVKYNVDLSLRGFDEEGSKMKQFYDTLQKLDDYMIDQGVKNSKQWFKSDLSRDVIKAFYTPMIRIPIDKDGNRKPYPPTIKLSLKQKRDSQDFDVQCYDEKKTLFKGIPLEELLVKGAQATCLIQCTGVWFAGSKFGLSWKLVQALITNLPQNARNLTFIDDGDLVPATTQSSQRQQTQVQQEDEEEETEEDEEEDEAFSAPPPAKPSVVAAVMPKATSAKVAPAPVESIDEDADDVDPVPVPKKATTIVKKKIVAKK
jgi:hypothetical protein